MESVLIQLVLVLHPLRDETPLAHFLVPSLWRSTNAHFRSPYRSHTLLVRTGEPSIQISDWSYNVSISTFLINRFLFFKTLGTHHANAGSWAIPLETEYSANSTGFESLIASIGIQDSVPSLHCTRISEPFVVILLRLTLFGKYTHPCSRLTAESSHQHC